MKKKYILKTILNYSIIIVLGALLALDYILFIVPNSFAPAGINGIAVMIQYAFDFSIGYMSLIINIPLCVLAFFFVNKRFAIRTLLFSVSYSLFYLLFNKISALQQFVYNAEGIDTIYPVLIAGTISGLISCFAFRLSSSTGGTDVIAKFVNKKWPNLNFFWVIFILNSLVAVASCFVYKEEGMLINYRPACLCIVYSFVASFLANTFIRGTKTAYKFFIITSNPELVEDIIIHRLKHSATRLERQGIYSHKGKTVLVSVCNKNQLIEFEKILKEIPDTFGFVETVYETLGNFKHIK